MVLPSLKDMYVSFGKYHAHPITKIVHCFCMPQMIMTAFTVARHFISEYEITIQGETYKYDLCLVWVFAMALIYMNIDFLTGILSAILYTGAWFLSRYLFLVAKENNQLNQHLALCFIWHIAGWASQFSTHFIFDKRKPAIFENILLTMAAPAFIILDVLFFLGYKKKVKQECFAAVEEDLRDIELLRRKHYKYYCIRHCT